MNYMNEKTKAISFPLGGIGTGTIGLAGHGGFTDMEIDNKPNKGSSPEFTHFAIKAEENGEVLDTRILQGDLRKNYMGSLERPKYTGFGFGPDRGSMAGFPHFSSSYFKGTYPIAEITFKHENFPGNVKMTAFNPLIPTNEDDSSIPAAFFEFEIENNTDKTIEYTLALSCNNFYSKINAKHRYMEQNNIKMIFLSNYGTDDILKDGNLAIATDCNDVSYQEYWFRGKWFDNSSVFWSEFSKTGKLKNRTYESSDLNAMSYNGGDIATLAAHVPAKPGEKKKIHFALSWSKPYMNHSWDITHIGLSREEIEKRRKFTWKNYYAALFETAKDSAVYSLKNFEKLFQETKLYTDAIFGSTLPVPVLDAVTANISILKSPTCLRLSDGSFYGFEGVHAHEGSCEGTCTHVWSYAYAPAFLFPRLERSARTNEYTYSMQEDGGMGVRLQLPLDAGPTNHRPALDGQFGTIMRVYREFIISGDMDWLKSIWPNVKRTIEYAWSEQNHDQWDPNRDGIAEGRQHHTLDMELFGPNSWLSGMYLGGLKAGAELAAVLGDVKAQETYMEIFEKGKNLLNRELFNGEYYFQKIDLKDRALLEQYNGGFSQHEANAVKSYWNEEYKEIKYQIGEGCSIDQVLGQWHADLLGLGEIFEKDKVESALNSIYKYNFIECMRDHINPCRIYGLDEEQGTMICSYPRTEEKPLIPIPYAEETMHGFEYQAASHMIKHGLTEEGIRCVKAVRDRYDGEKRNPWNEMECGSNYARSMSSYALLLVYSGFQYDLYHKTIGFDPIVKDAYQYFWSLDTGFGIVQKTDHQLTLDLKYGYLELKHFRISTASINAILFENHPIKCNISDSEITFDDTIKLLPNKSLCIQYS